MRLLSIFLAVAVLTLALARAEDPLADAVQRGDVSTFKALLAKGVAIDPRDEKGWTPLIHAIHLGRTEMAQMLLDAGADVRATTKGGSSALAFAAGRANPSMVKTLLARGADWRVNKAQPVWTAITGGNLEILQAMMARGAEPTRVEFGTTPLMAATFRGHQTMVDFLLASGADINGADESRATPLLVAAKKGMTTIARTLIAKGARVDAVGSCGDSECTGHTALMYAAESGEPELVKILLAAGADARALESAALKTADLNGQVEIARLLIAADAKMKSSAESHPARALTAGVSSRAPSADDRVTAALTHPRKFVSAPAAKPSPPIRLAIIPDGQNVASADLLTAALSRQSGLALVEREQIARVLAEHALLRDLQTHPPYAQLGRLLNANALVFLQTRSVSSQEILEVRVVSVNPGVVLDSIYASLPLGDPAAWAQSLRERVAAMLPKFGVSAADAIPISMVNLRASIDLAPAREAERALTALLAHRLVHEPHFFVLERRDMERLLLEKDLARPEPAGFWTAGCLLDGRIDVGFGDSREVTLTLNLRPGKGGPGKTIAIKGDQARLADLAEAALARINEALSKETSGSKWRPEAEAQQYFEEAAWADALGAHEIARRSSESSWALGLRTFDLARIRVRSCAREIEAQRTAMQENINRALPGVRPCDFSKDPLNHPHRGADALSAPQLLDLGIHALEAYSEGLHLLRREPPQLARWLALSKETFSSATIPLLLVRSASDQIENEERLKTLRKLFQEVSDEVVEVFAETPSASSAAIDFLALKAAQARWWHGDDLATAVRDLFAKRFTTNDATHRARLREAVVRSCAGMSLAGEYFDEGRPRRGWLELAKTLSGETAPEDQFVGYFLSYHLARPQREKEQAAAKFVELLPQVSRVAAAEPAARVHYVRIFDQLSDDLWARTNLPLFQLNEVAQDGRALLKKTAEADALHAGLAGKPSTDGWAGRRVTPAAAPKKTVTRFWHPFALHLPGAGEPENFHFKDTTFTWAEGKIWCYGEFGEYGSDAEKFKGFIFQIDPATFQTSVIAVPPFSARDDRTTLAVSDRFVVLCRARGFLARYERASKEWRVFDEIKPAVGRLPLLADERLYVEFDIDGNRGVAALDHATNAIELLVSNRRKPAISPLDAAVVRVSAIQLGVRGEVAIETKKQSPGTERPATGDTFIYDPRHKSWQQATPGAFASTQSSTATPLRRASRSPAYDFKIGPDQPMLHGIQLWDGSLAQRIEKRPPYLMYPLPPGTVFPCDGQGAGFWFIPADAPP